MFRKNTAGQFIHFQGVDAATGGIKSGVTWTVRRCIDGTFAAGGGTVTEDGTTGWYKYAMTQADTNGNDIGFSFTGTGAVPQTVNIVTTAADPTDAVRLGLTALPNAAAEAAGGLYTRGTGAGQINQPANGQVDANAVKLGGTTQTGRDIGASVLLSSGSGAGQLDFTSGVVKTNLSQILGTALTETSGQIAAAFKKFFDKASPTGTINSLPDAVPDASGGLPVTGTRLTAIPTLPAALVGGRIDASVGAYQSGQAPLQPTTAGRTLDVSTGGEAGVDWANVGSPTSTVDLSGTTVGIATTLTNAPSDSSGVTTLLSRLSALRAGYLDNLSAGAAALESSLQALITTVGAAGVGLTATASAVWSVATRLLTAGTNIVLAKGTGVTGFNDLPQADIRSAVGLASANLDTQLSTIDDFLDTEIGAIKAKTDNIPAAPAAVGDVPTTSEIADAVLSSLTLVDVSFPSTPVLDTFNRADEGPPASANWTNKIADGFGGWVEPGHEVISSQLANTFQDVAQDYWNVAQLGPDCEAYITVVDSTGLISVGLAARLTDIGQFTTDGYSIQVNPSGGSGENRNYQIFRIDNGGSGGVLHLLTSASESSVGSMDGDKYGIRCIGNNIQLWGDTGSGWELKLSAVDSTYNNRGFIGLITEVGPVARFDDFGGGNIVFPADGSLQFNAGAIADAVWDEDIVADHQDADTAGKKLSQALILYEGN